jgi:hypothetical protein
MLHEILWQQNAGWAAACLRHPLVRGLADGTLDPEAFRRYVAQDAFFLNTFARPTRWPPSAARTWSFRLPLRPRLAPFLPSASLPSADWFFRTACDPTARATTP